MHCEMWRVGRGNSLLSRRKHEEEQTRASTMVRAVTYVYSLRRLWGACTEMWGEGPGNSLIFREGVIDEGKMYWVLVQDLRRVQEWRGYPLSFSFAFSCTLRKLIEGKP